MAVANREDLPHEMALTLASDQVRDVAKSARSNQAVRRRVVIRVAVVVLEMAAVGIGEATVLQ